MKIVFLSHYFPPEGNAPASRTYEHCSRWVKDGAQVTVITCAPNVPNGVVYEGYKNRFWPQRETVDGIEVIRVWSFIAPNAGAIRRIVNYATYMMSAVFAFLFFCKRPQVVIATSPQFFCGWAGTICSIIKWCPFVLEIRDIWPESIIAVGAMKRGIVTWFLEIVEKWMYQSATHIVAVGDGYKDAILKRAPELTNVSVITNGVDLNQFSPDDANNQFFDQWDLTGRFVCSYVGTIGMAHGLEVVLDAAETLKGNGRNDIAFCLVGDGANRNRLQTECEDRGLDTHVVFTGRLPKSDMKHVLASSNALLIHLKPCDLFSTVIPSKIFEAMAMGRPIIMGVDGQAREIVAASESGLDMERGSAESLIENVTRLADDKELAGRLSRSARPFVSKHYTRDVLAAQYLRILNSVVNKQPFDAATQPPSASSSPTSSRTDLKTEEAI